MKIKLNSLEQVEAFRTKIDNLLGYPNKENGTETYCNIPELTEVKDNDSNIVESHQEIDITDELNGKLVALATKQAIQNEIIPIDN